MSTAFHSDAWYRVEGLKPRLAREAQVHRQRYRGTPWYVVIEPAGGRLHRFTPAAYLVISLMDGQRSIEAIWQAAALRLGDDAPTQDELLDLVSRLYNADLLLADVAPDVAEVLHRGARQRRSRWLRNIANPMSLRLPLWDPDAFLTATLPAVGWLFGRAGLLLWAALVLPALLLAGAHWQALSGNLSDRVLAADNLLLLVLVFPVIKALHELAHGWAVKRGGGEVHEMGLMFLIFAPIPYVDASASSGFRSRGMRAGVAAAGMLAETALAALALFFWLLAEPGLARSLAFNVMVVAGVSTLVFNANPLLRYDGYFILCDLIGMPNLGQRATAWWAWLVQHHGFGAHHLEPPDEGPAERRILLWYGALSWIYRMVVVFGIALFVASQFFFVGVLFAVWGVATGFAWPLLKALRHVLVAPALARQRTRAVGLTLGGMSLLVLVLALVPVPMSAYAEGVVWVPEQAEIRTGGAGRIDRLLVAAGSQVRAGQPVAQLDEPGLWAELDVQLARIERLEVQLATLLGEERAQAAALSSTLARERQALARMAQRVDALLLRAGSGGRLVVPRATDIDGRWLRQGELLGHVLDGQLRSVRVVVRQDDIGLVRNRLEQVRVRIAGQSEQAHAARLVRAVPGGSDRLPSAALAVAGGGRHATDPADPDGLKTLNRVFQFELELPADVGTLQMGTRAHVRFELASEPLAQQLWRRLRQLFLSHFDV